jgi:ATP-dependent helicase/nuclease subunit A
MAAYRAALSVIFPEARIEVALLYTAAPRLIVLDDATLDAAKPRFSATEQSLGANG